MTDRKTEEAVKFARASLALDGLTHLARGRGQGPRPTGHLPGRDIPGGVRAVGMGDLPERRGLLPGRRLPGRGRGRAGTVRSTHGLRLLPCRTTTTMARSRPPTSEAEEGRRHKGGYRCHQPRGVTGAGKHLVTRGQPAQAQALRPRPALLATAGVPPRYPLTHAETAQNGLQRVFCPYPTQPLPLGRLRPVGPLGPWQRAFLFPCRLPRSAAPAFP